MAITARRTQSNVDLQPVSQVRVRGADVSSGLTNVARGLGDVGNVISQEAVRVKVEDDDAAVFDAFNQAQQGHEQRFNGENGFNTLQGKEATNALSEANTYLEDSKQNVSEMLANDSQREKFKVLMDKSSAGRVAGLTRHVENERVKFNDNVLTTTVTNEFGRAVNNPGDEEIRQDALFNAELALREKFKGQSGEFIAGKLKELREGMNQEIVLQLVETDFEQAQEYLNANFDDIPSAVRNNVEGKIKKKKHDLKVYQTTDEITKKYADEGDAILATQKIKDPKERKEVEGNVTRHYANQRRVEKIRETDDLNTDWNALIDFNDKNEANGVNAIINQQEDAKAQLAMRNYIAITNAGKATQTTPGVYSEALQVARVSPDVLQLFIDRNKDQLSIGDYKKFADMANKSLEDKDVDLKTATTENQQLKSILGEFKLYPDKDADAKEIARYNDYMLQYEQAKTDWSKANGDRVPNVTERDKIARRLLTEHVTQESNWWFTSDDTAPFFELSDDEKNTAASLDLNKGFYAMSANQLMNLSPDQLAGLNSTGVNMSVITPEQKNALVKQLGVQGLAATDENIKALYITFLQGRTR